ncbi:MAG: hypothetical protein IJH86_05195 [Clostridia bacterium]|nr:hypothetical protein [Clostridia bacterium]
MRGLRRSDLDYHVQPARGGDPCRTQALDADAEGDRQHQPDIDGEALDERPFKVAKVHVVVDEE